METDDVDTLRAAWEQAAREWAAWARAPGHDSYWRFHRDAFLRIVPAPGCRTLDLGCGEGRLSRDLAALGHRVTAVDASPTLVRLARAAEPEIQTVVADAAHLPLADAAFDLVVAFMSLMDMDDMPGALREAARVLLPGGRLALAVVHPLNSAGDWVDKRPGAPFALTRSYFDRRRYLDRIEEDGLSMTFSSIHWTLADYFSALTERGFVVEALREVTDDDHARWRRIPMFLHLRALRGNAPQPG